MGVIVPSIHGGGGDKSLGDPFQRSLHQFPIPNVDVEDNEDVPRVGLTMLEDVVCAVVCRTIFIVFRLVQCPVGQDLLRVVGRPSVVIHAVRIDGHVGRPVGIRIVQAYNDESSNKHAAHTLQGREERGGQLVLARHVVIKSRPWIEPHPTVESGDDSEIEVVWRNPGHPVECP